MEIRDVTPADEPAAEAVVAAAFGEPADGRVVQMMRALQAGGAARAGLVAVVDGELAGHVGLSRGWVDARRELVDVLVLSPLSVRPDLQGQGVGTALVAAALAAAEDRGAPAVFLEGSPGYYGRRGFSSGSALGFDRPSTRIPDPGFQVALLSSHQPWMVGRLIYPEAFWATDTVGLRDPDLEQVEAQIATASASRGGS
ncbi:N-acetyltransferase [Actinoplanes ianthinogenes]|uniref:N-acetyltransferase n=1 Tax=Actinoplanes ianthinogenes TaxID=122358 RepID=A0ABM7M7A6_9ACTN|nr:GNAT family N-acetyltransferase [Actinoplanes ianthinogenes]BCJ47482.1 N-acetyltransferase [Actinoplanes ianthinogenes]GGR02071.1 N-acetyltransferase [Actinoplanes ianthinogenes]